ncbi:MAG: FAD-dependent oxidoreductase [Dehalococcoidia bacterium]|nr:FAD-dependent oxidoreductase [Dehalococcoidia bacterium]MDZ4247057.1 FAD-dependent oxidoreductase [Dehalococcoidia bacterium]
MSKVRVAVVGGGFAGIAAAISAKKAGADVVLFEKTDMLAGSGLRAGRMNFNGKLVAAEEAKALGGGDVFEALESILLHRGNIVDELHGYIYDTSKVDTVMQRLVNEAGVELRIESRVDDVENTGGVIKSIRVNKKEKVKADVFIDSPGTSGGMNICKRYGQGCIMCICYRCPAYGDRFSIATKAGAPSYNRVRPDGTPGAVGSAVLINKTTLAPDLLRRMEKEGAIGIPLPKELIDYSKEKMIGGVRSRRQMEYINLVDIGSTAKCVGLGYFNLRQLRSIPGFEYAQYDEPMAGGKFNKISKVDMCARDNSLKVEGFNNLFAAGEKCGPGTGIGECILSGFVAGHNAVRVAAGKAPVILPRETVSGDFIAYTGEKMKTPGGLNQGYSFGMGEFFERMKDQGVYTTDVAAIHKKINGLQLKGVFAKKVT